MKAKMFTLVFLLFSMAFYAQEKRRDFSVGVFYGFGRNVNKEDYFYNSHCFKLRISGVIKESKHFRYELFIQPQLNFVKHKLLNLNYVSEDLPDYIQKREEFGNLKSITDYVFNVGFVIKKSISERYDVFVLVSTGPMITDTETERLSKGFAFSSVLSMGIAINYSHFSFEFGPNYNHISNAGLQETNSGYSVLNFELGLKYRL